MSYHNRKQERKTLLLFFSNRLWNFRGSKDIWPDDPTYRIAVDLYFTHHSVTSLIASLDSQHSLVSLSLWGQEKDLHNLSVTLKQTAIKESKAVIAPYWLATLWNFTINIIRKLSEHQWDMHTVSLPHSLSSGKWQYKMPTDASPICFYTIMGGIEYQNWENKKSLIKPVKS